MSVWEKFVRSLMSEGETPNAFSLFHIIALIILICLAVLIVIFNKKINKHYRIILIITWIVLLVLEVFVQITYSYYSFYAEFKTFVFRYNWNFFPFQFCSSPYYLLPFVIFLKEGPLKKRFELFTAIFFMVGGVFGTFLPAFSKVIWINYQTLVHHEMMMLMSILMALKNRKEFVLKKYLQTILIFLGLVIIAQCLNAIIPAIVPEAPSRDGFNMFFISWHTSPKIAVLSSVYKALPYPLYLVLYIIGFILITFVIYIALSLIINRKVDFTFISKTKNKHK